MNGVLWGLGARDSLGSDGGHSLGSRGRSRMSAEACVGARIPSWPVRQPRRQYSSQIAELAVGFARLETTRAACSFSAADIV